MPKITTEWQRFDALTAAQLYELLRFRQSIFIVEQSSPYPDLDGLDQDARHLQLQVDGTLVGYLRLIAMPGPPPAVRIGRIAVAPHLRRRGLGRRLMVEALLICRAQYPGRLAMLTAQTYLVPFYQSFGFEPTGEPFDDFGVSHVDMEFRR